MTDFTTPEALAFREAFYRKYRKPHERFAAAAKKAKYIEAYEWSFNVSDNFEEYWKEPYQNKLDNLIGFDIIIPHEKYDQSTLDTIVSACTDIIGFEPDSMYDNDAPNDLTYWHMDEPENLGDYSGMTALVGRLEAEIRKRLTRKRKGRK